MAQLDSYLRTDLKPRHLHLLVALDNIRNLGRAAETMHVTQPAVSKSLAELERGLGLRLFERTSRGVHPTIYGECLIRHARSVLTDLAQARDELRGLASGSSGNISVGVLATAALALLPRALAMLKSRHPGMTVLVREGSSVREREVGIGEMNAHEAVVTSGLQDGAVIERNVNRPRAR